MELSNGGSPSRLRRTLANASIVVHGFIMFLVWAALLIYLSLQMLKISPTLSWLAIGLMAICFFFGAHLLPGSLYDLRSFEVDGRLYRRLGVRRIRYFVGQGDGIQSFARLIDPSWRSPLSRMSPEEHLNWTKFAESLHTSYLIASFPTILVGYYLGFKILATVILVLNVPFNVYPVLIQRYTRAKLERINKLLVKRNTTRSLSS